MPALRASVRRLEPAGTSISCFSFLSLTKVTLGMERRSSVVDERFSGDSPPVRRMVMIVRGERGEAILRVAVVVGCRVGRVFETHRPWWVSKTRPTLQDRRESLS